MDSQFLRFQSPAAIDDLSKRFAAYDTLKMERGWYDNHYFHCHSLANYYFVDNDLKYLVKRLWKNAFRMQIPLYCSLAHSDTAQETDPHASGAAVQIKHLEHHLELSPDEMACIRFMADRIIRPNKLQIHEEKPLQWVLDDWQPRLRPLPPMDYYKTPAGLA